MPDLDLLPGAARAAAFPEPTGANTTPRVLTGFKPEPLPERDSDFQTTRQRVLRILSLGLAHPRPGQQELEFRQHEQLIRDATWDEPRRIAVVSPKGGVGKTPAALILAGILAQYRSSVAVWDACDAAGTLHARAGGHQQRCVSDIITHPERYRYVDPLAVAACAATQTSRADVLGSLREREFNAEDINEITAVLDRVYRIQIADTGNTAHSPAYTAAVANAHLLVIPTTRTVDSVNKAVGLLTRLQATRDLAQRAVVIISDVNSQVSQASARSIFADCGVGAVLEVPYDDHIAAGTEVDVLRLSRPSLLAWTRAAAAAVVNLEI